MLLYMRFFSPSSFKTRSRDNQHILVSIIIVSWIVYRLLKNIVFGITRYKGGASFNRFAYRNAEHRLYIPPIDLRLEPLSGGKQCSRSQVKGLSRRKPAGNSRKLGLKDLKAVIFPLDFSKSFYKKRRMHV